MHPTARMRSWPINWAQVRNPLFFKKKKVHVLKLEWLHIVYRVPSCHSNNSPALALAAIPTSLAYLIPTGSSFLAHLAM